MDEKLKITILEQLRVLDENYIPLVSYPIIDGDKKIFLGEKEKRTCRFCGRSKADGVTFKKEAHALSNLIGNNSLFSYYECDECNQRFSIYEGDFAEFMKIYHCILKVKGKRGIPSYRMNTSRVDIEGTTTAIKQFEGDPTLQCNIDEVNKKLTITALRTYTPIHVYKALLKMALTILPKEDLEHCMSALKFLNKEPVSVKIPLPVVIQMYGQGADVHHSIMGAIFKRRENAKGMVFSYVFLLAYNNMCFQMPIFGSDLDKFAKGESVRFHTIPTFPLLDGYPLILDKLVDLASSEKKVKEPISLSFTFADFERTDYDPETGEELP